MIRACPAGRSRRHLPSPADPLERHAAIGLQAASLATALPFSVILLLMCVATLRGLRHELRASDRAARLERLTLATAHITGEVWEGMPGNPKLRSYLDDRIDYRVSRSLGLLRVGSRGRSRRRR